MAVQMEKWMPDATGQLVISDIEHGEYEDLTCLHDRTGHNEFAMIHVGDALQFGLPCWKAFSGHVVIAP